MEKHSIVQRYAEGKVTMIMVYDHNINQILATYMKDSRTLICLIQHNISMYNIQTISCMIQGYKIYWFNYNNTIIMMYHATAFSDFVNWVYLSINELLNRINKN